MLRNFGRQSTSLIDFAFWKIRRQHWLNVGHVLTVVLWELKSISFLIPSMPAFVAILKKFKFVRIVVIHSAVYIR